MQRRPLPLPLPLPLPWRIADYHLSDLIGDAIRSKKLALFLSSVRLRNSAITNLVPLLSAYRKMYMGDQVLGYTCTMCSKFYKMWSNYLKHKCEPPQFKCPLCPFAAFKAFILHAHQAEQHFKVTSPNTWTFRFERFPIRVSPTRYPIALIRVEASSCLPAPLAETVFESTTKQPVYSGTRILWFLLFVLASRHRFVSESRP